MIGQFDGPWYTSSGHQWLSSVLHPFSKLLSIVTSAPPASAYTLLDIVEFDGIIFTYAFLPEDSR